VWCRAQALLETTIERKITGHRIVVPSKMSPSQRRYMSLESLARVTDNPTVRLPAVAT